MAIGLRSNETVGLNSEEVELTKIALLPEQTADETTWRAIAGEKQSVGRTAGEALDAIAAQLNDEEGGTLIIMQSQRPDKFFGEEKRLRLQMLMEQWREARDKGGTLSPDDQSELQSLAEEEVRATMIRSSALLGAPTP